MYSFLKQDQKGTAGLSRIRTGNYKMELIQLIAKDVIAEDESKKVIVSLRVLYLVGLVAFVLDLIWAGPQVLTQNQIRILLLLAANVILFFHTYHSRTRLALILYIIYVLAWTLLMIPCFGWSAGLQNYYIILLMLTFFAVLGSLQLKVGLAAGLLFLRIILIWVYGGIRPMAEIGSVFDKLMQITNIVAVFGATIFISYYYSHKENEAENKLIKYNTRLRQAANTDQLTGLWNRRRALDYLADLSKTDGVSFASLAIGDIDFFKKVNDEHGHDVGDVVLKAVSDVMREYSRSDTFIARWGGEEFLLVFPNCNGDHAFIAMERMRQAVQDHVVHAGGTDISVTMTYGLTEVDFHKSMDEAIKEADDKLYIGKGSGRNKVVY